MGVFQANARGIALPHGHPILANLADGMRWHNEKIVHVEHNLLDPQPQESSARDVTVIGRCKGQGREGCDSIHVQVRGLTYPPASGRLSAID